MSVITVVIALFSNTVFSIIIIVIILIVIAIFIGVVTRVAATSTTGTAAMVSITTAFYEIWPVVSITPTTTTTLSGYTQCLYTIGFRCCAF